MGSSGGDNGASLALQQKQMEESQRQAELSRAQTIMAQEVVTPAVARSIQGDTEKATAAQGEARNRLRGVRGTYNRYAQMEGSGGNGSAEKLG